RAGELLQRGHAPEERDAPDQVAAVDRSLAGLLEVHRGSGTPRPRLLILDAQLGAVPSSLVEVERKDLLVFGEAIGARPLQPPRKPCVQIRAFALRQAVVS